MTCLKIKTQRSCSFKRKAYCLGEKDENMREAWRIPMSSPQLLAKRKSKPTEEFSQRTAQQYSYDIELERH